MSRWAPTGDATAVVGLRLVILLFEAITVGQILAQSDERIGPVDQGVAVVLSVVVTASFLVAQRMVIRHRRPSWLLVLVATQVVGALAIMWLVNTWPLFSLALASLLLVVRAPYSLVAAVLLSVVGTLALSDGADGTPLVILAGVVATNLVVGFVLYAMTRLVMVLDELRRTRERLARSRIDEERFRISRDLHDILGRTLVAVSLRNEAALRLLDEDPERCRRQLTELQSTILEGQAQLRSLTSGPTLVGLADELATAQDLFDRLGIRSVIDAVEVEDPAVDQTLAAVVREAVTNTLKHGRPSTCRIGVREESLAIVLSVVNDGAVGAGADSGHTGLEDIATRVAMLGGVLTAGPVPGQRFRVIARVPYRVGAVVEDAAPDRLVTSDARTAP